MKIICPFCKRKFKSIMAHLKIHQISVVDFLKKYPNFKMVSDITKNKCSKTCIDMGVGKQNKGVKRSDLFKKNLSNVFSGEGNPFFGKKHSVQTKNKMSSNHSDFNGEKNPFKKWYWASSEDIKNKYKNLCIQKWKKMKISPKYKELCEKRSVVTAELHINGKIKSYGKGHKYGYFFSKKQNKKIFYRSSYERLLLQESPRALVVG